jgi:hypothetical protein
VLPLEGQLVKSVCKKMMAVSCKSPTKHFNTLCGKYAKFLALNLAAHVCFNGRPRRATDVLQPAGLLYRGTYY